MLGLVPIPVLVAARPKTALLFTFMFIGYFIHSFLHNTGYFVTDLIGWAAIAVFLHERDAGRLTWERQRARAWASATALRAKYLRTCQLKRQPTGAALHLRGARH